MPRTLDRDERLRAVTSAVWRLLAREGIGAMSVRKVAAEAGLPPSSLRYVFPTQTSVREHAIEMSVERFTARVGAVDIERPDWARLVLLELLPLDEDRLLEAEVYLALGTAALTDPSLRGARERFVDTARSTCAAALADLLGQDDPPEVEAARLHALVDGLALQVVHQGPDGDARWAVDVLDRHLADLTGGPGRPGRHEPAGPRATAGRSVATSTTCSR